MCECDRPVSGLGITPKMNTVKENRTAAKGSREIMGFFFPEAVGYDLWRAMTDLLDLLLKGIVGVLDHHHCSSNTTQNK